MNLETQRLIGLSPVPPEVDDIRYMTRVNTTYLGKINSKITVQLLMSKQITKTIRHTRLNATTVETEQFLQLNT